MTAVKICGLTRPQDAQAAAQAGADVVGLVFAPSPRQVTISQARKIIAVLPWHIVRVGVFVNAAPKRVCQIMEALGLDRLQFHGQESSEFLRQFPLSRVIQALRPPLGLASPKQDPAPAAGAFLVDAYVPGRVGGTGQLSNWQYAYDLKKFSKPVILSGGLTIANVKEAIHQAQPDMVDVSSGVEISPGIKSAQKMKAFIQMVKSLT